MDVGLLALRLGFGLGLAGHGAWKFGRFRGPGIAGVGGFFESLGYRPGRLVAVGLAALEIAAGLALAAGFVTPLAGAVVIGVMLAAIATAKRGEGWIGGSELELLYAIAGAALAFTGSGAVSIDAALGWELAGNAWGLGAVGLGAVSAGLALVSRRPRPTVQAVQEAA